MSHNAQALGHRMPLKRIDMDPVWPSNPNDELAPAYLDRVEADRIWRAVLDTARGTNAPMPVPAMSPESVDRDTRGEI